MSKPTIVIVPGSFTAAAAYDNLTSILSKQFGYEVIVGTLQSTVRAPPAKGATMQEDAAYFRGMIEALSNQGKDVVVVGHSYGGFVATESVNRVTKPERQQKGAAGGAVRVVYLAALVPAIGESSLLGMGGQLGPTISIMGEYMYFDQDTGAPYLYVGMSADEAKETGRKFITSHSTMSFLDPATYAAVEHIPVTYIHTTKDNIVSLERQQASVEKLKQLNAANVSTVSIAEAHMPMVLAPEVTAKAIVDAITQG